MLAKSVASDRLKGSLFRASSFVPSPHIRRSAMHKTCPTRLTAVYSARLIHSSTKTKDELDDTDAFYVDSLLRDIKSGSRRALSKAITMGTLAVS